MIELSLLFAISTHLLTGNIWRGIFDLPSSLKIYVTYVKDLCCRSRQRVLRNRQAATRSKAKKKQQFQVLKDRKSALEAELEELDAQHAAAEQRVAQLHLENKALLDQCKCPKLQQ